MIINGYMLEPELLAILELVSQNKAASLVAYAIEISVDKKTLNAMRSARNIIGVTFGAMVFADVILYMSELMVEYPELIPYADEYVFGVEEMNIHRMN